MNFLLAIAIISYLFSAVGVPIAGDKVTVGQVLKDSPAAIAGLKTGDILNSIDNARVTSAEQLVSVTKKHLGEKITLQITRNGNKQSVIVTPRKNYPKDQGPMGIAISQNVVIQKYPWYKAPFLGTKEAISESWMIIAGIVGVLYQLIFFGIAPQGLAGPVGIAQLTGQFVQIGPNAVLSFVALLS